MSGSEKMEKVVLITGAGEGIGYYIAKYFLEQNDQVIISDYSLAKAQAAVDSLGFENAHAIKLDVEQEADFHQAKEFIEAKFKRLDLVVNNAAMTKTTPIFEITADEYSKIAQVNQLGVFLSCQILGAYMGKFGIGRIVNMSSLAGQNGGVAVGAHYAASEGAIITLTKIFAKELSASGVTVNAIACGPIDSPAFHRLVPKEDIPNIVNAIPAKTLGDMTFIAQTINLLAQKNSGFVTGATWDMNGGLLMR